ncbi:MAG: hypothetical protein ACK42G_06045 [Candidatus Kapaibacteriota bacterium]
MSIFDFLKKRKSVESVYKAFEIEEEKKSFYEKGCDFSSKFIKIRAPKEEELNNVIQQIIS